MLRRLYISMTFQHGLRVANLEHTRYQCTINYARVHSMQTPVAADSIDDRAGASWPRSSVRHVGECCMAVAAQTHPRGFSVHVCTRHLPTLRFYPSSSPLTTSPFWGAQLGFSIVLYPLNFSFAGRRGAASSRAGSPAAGEQLAAKQVCIFRKTISSLESIDMYSL